MQTPNLSHPFSMVSIPLQEGPFTVSANPPFSLALSKSTKPLPPFLYGVNPSPRRALHGKCKPQTSPTLSMVSIPLQEGPFTVSANPPFSLALSKSTKPLPPFLYGVNPSPRRALHGKCKPQTSPTLSLWCQSLSKKGPSR